MDNPRNVVVREETVVVRMLDEAGRRMGLTRSAVIRQAVRMFLAQENAAAKGEPDEQTTDVHQLRA